VVTDIVTTKGSRRARPPDVWRLFANRLDFDPLPGRDVDAHPRPGRAGARDVRVPGRSAQRGRSRSAAAGRPGRPAGCWCPPSTTRLCRPAVCAAVPRAGRVGLARSPCPSPSSLSAAAGRRGAADPMSAGRRGWEEDSPAAPSPQPTLEARGVRTNAAGSDRARVKSLFSANGFPVGSTARSNRSPASRRKRARDRHSRVTPGPTRRPPCHRRGRRPVRSCRLTLSARLG
jgi:hypothetical protein